MKNFFGILRYVKGYWRYAIWNIVFNVFSVVFSFFSIALLFPFLNVLFSNNSNEVATMLAAGEPRLVISKDSITAYIKYLIAHNSEEHGKLYVLIAICLFVVVAIFFKNLFRYLAMYFISPIRNGVVRDIRNKVFNKTLDLPLSYYSEEKKGDIISRMTTDVQEIEWSIMKSLEMTFREPLNILVFVVMMFVISTKLTVIAFVLFP